MNYQLSESEYLLLKYNVGFIWRC